MIEPLCYNHILTRIRTIGVIDGQRVVATRRQITARYFGDRPRREGSTDFHPGRAVDMDRRIQIASNKLNSDFDSVALLCSEGIAIPLVDRIDRALNADTEN